MFNDLAQGVRSSLSAKLLLPLALLSVVTIFLLSLISWSLATRQVSDDRGRLLAGTAQQMAAQLDERANSHRQALEVLLQHDNWNRSQWGESQQAALVKIKSTYPDFNWIGAVDVKGNVVVDTDGSRVGTNLSRDIRFLIGKRGEYIGEDSESATFRPELKTSEALDSRHVDIALPIVNDEQRLLGVVIGELSLKGFVDFSDTLLAPLGESGPVTVWLFDKNGSVILMPSTSAAPPTGWSPSLIRSTSSSSYGYDTLDWFDNEQYLTGFARNENYPMRQGLNWIVVVQQNIEEAFSSAARARNLVLLAALCMSMISLYCLWFLLGRFLSPLKGIAKAADAIRQGNDNAEITPCNRHDEVGTLANSLAEMNRQQRDYQGRLEAKVAERTRQLQAANEELLSISESDQLLQIANRRRFDQQLEEEWGRALRDQLPVSLLMIDVDHFKAYNDHYGHPAGDQCLKQLAKALADTVNRATDLVARYGGEEFAVLLHNTHLDGALKLSRRIHRVVEKVAILHGHSPVSPRVTLSIGVTCIQPGNDTGSPKSFVERADKALYQAKAGGRNRTCYWREAAADGKKASGS